MRKISVAAVQLGLYPHDYPKAIAEAERSTKAAVKRGARLVCLPEHWLMSRVLEEDNAVLRRFSGVARELDAYVNLGAYYEKRRSGTFLTSVMVSPAGEAYFRQDKVHLYRSENRIGTPGSGFGICVVDGFKVGVLVCHDAVFPEAARTVSNLGAELLLIPSLIKKAGALPWLYYLRARALENRVPLVSPNIYHAPKVVGESRIIDLDYDKKEHVMGLVETQAKAGAPFVLTEFDLAKNRVYRKERLGELRPDIYQKSRAEGR